MAQGQQAQDDSASLFFLLAILFCIVVPWAFAFIWNLLFPGRKEILAAFPSRTENGLRVRQCQTQAMVSNREDRLQKLRSRWRLCTRGFALRAIILGVLSCWLLYITLQVRALLATSAMYQNFDPFEILDVGRSTSVADIKKAFRRMSLKYHPDKNPEPEAANMFMRVKKAYDALTDPVAKRNYAKYGNPDGPTRIELSVALPTVSKEYQGIVLVLFVLLFVIGVPLSLLLCMGGNGDVCPNGVLRATMEALSRGVSLSLDVRSAQELLLNSNESLALTERPEDAEALATIFKELGGSRRASGRSSQSAGPSKAEVLFLSYVKRRPDLLSDALKEDLKVLHRQWRLVTQAIINTAAQMGSADAVAAAVELHACLVQALEPGAGVAGGAPLLQIPHFTMDHVKSWRKGPRKSANLRAFLELPAEARTSSFEGLDLTAQELADIDEFASFAPRVSIDEASVFVEGESGVCYNDVATLRVVFTRANLREGEAAGAAHTPLFASAAVPEAWWLVLTTPGGKRGSNTKCLRVTDPGPKVEVSLRFRVQKVGKSRCTVSLFCEAYVGLDVEQQFHFDAKEATEDADSDASELEGDLDDSE